LIFICCLVFEIVKAGCFLLLSSNRLFFDSIIRMASKHRNVSPYQTPRRGLNRGYKRKVSDFQKPTQPKRNRQINPTRLTDFSFQHHRQSNDVKGNKGWYNPNPWANDFNFGVNNGISVFEDIESNSSNNKL